jgi:hypothetical protein
MNTRMLRQRLLLTVLTVLTVPTVLWSQDDVRARLESRGLPTDLVDQVTAIAADATARGLPTAPLADKAIEGFAKQVPGARIVAVVRQYGERMIDARNAVQTAGVSAPEGRLITAATDAMGRGFVADDIGRVVRAGPRAEIATPGLTVAAALVAQGMPTSVATDIVAQAIQRGSSPAQILDLPSVARTMQSQGMSPSDAGREMLHGGRGPGGPDGNGGPRPDGPRVGGEDRGGHGPPGGRGGPGSPSGPPQPRPDDHRGPGGRPPRPE